jgi:phage terminase large subunit-like protein
MAKLSSAIARARAIAKRDKWPAEMVRTEADARAVLDGGCSYSPHHAALVVRFFHEFLHHSIAEWAGKPFDLLPWQKDELINPLFGWLRKDGTRRYRRGGVWIPKKQGKTTLASGICLYLLVGDGEPGAQVFSAANDRNQAAYIYRDCAAHVKQSEDLRGILDLVDSKKRINYVQQNAYYEALSADVPTKEGLNISGLVVDELHAIQDRSLWSTLAYGGASRRQPLLLSISTAGIYDPASIGWEQYRYACGVRDGTIEDWSFFSLIYEADPKADWTDPAVWQATNPSYGVTAKVEQYHEECREAQESPAKQNDFLRYRLNIWVQQNTRAIDLRVWDENDAHLIDEDDGREWYGGLDLGGSSDISAWVMVARCADDADAVDVRCRFWLPEATLSSKHPNAGLYRQWVKSGHLMTTPGNVTDERFIQAQIIEDAKRFRFIDGNIDRLFQGMRMTIELADEGVTLAPLGQGFFSMAVPTKKFLDLVTGRRLHHGANPILRWMADNVVLKRDAAGNSKVDKEKSAQKVDGIVACIMAIDRLERHMAVAPSIYDQRGIRTLGETLEAGHAEH